MAYIHISPNLEVDVTMERESDGVSVLLKDSLEIGLMPVWENGKSSTELAYTLAYILSEIYDGNVPAVVRTLRPACETSAGTSCKQLPAASSAAP